MSETNGQSAHTFAQSPSQAHDCQFFVLTYSFICRFCNNLDSLLIRYKSTDPIRHKSYLSYYNHEYEMCYETFTIELLVFNKLLLARLVSYNLVRKDRSVIPVQFTTSFVSYKKGLKELDKPSPSADSTASSAAKSD